MKFQKTLLAISVTAFSSAVVASEAVRLDVASAFSTQTFFGKSAQNVSGDLETMSDGNVSMRVYDPGELIPAFDILSSVSSGAVPAGWSTIAYFGGTIPVANLYGALPFSPTAEAVFSWTFDGDGRELLQSSLDQYGIKVLPCSYIPQEPGGWFNKEINSTEDFQGLSMRISGLGARVLNKFGASTQLIAGDEVYLALERGRVDAAEFSIPEVDNALGLSEIAENYYFPGWHQGAGWLALLINQSVWDGYSDVQQAQFETACRANIQREFSSVIPKQMEVLDDLRAQGVNVERFSDEILSEMHEVWQAVVEEERNENPAFGEAYDSLMSHAAMIEEWYDLQALPSVR